MYIYEPLTSSLAVEHCQTLSNPRFVFFFKMLPKSFNLALTWLASKTARIDSVISAIAREGTKILRWKNTRMITNDCYVALDNVNFLLLGYWVVKWGKPIVVWMLHSWGFWFCRRRQKFWTTRVCQATCYYWYVKQFLRRLLIIFITNNRDLTDLILTNFSR